MKVCASINLGPFNHEAIMFTSIAEAVRYFRSEVAGIDYGTGTDEQVMDLYPQCKTSAGLRCHSGATFHDWPMVRYAVGPRGGIARKGA
jgi:hypothetical protein